MSLFINHVKELVNIPEDEPILVIRGSWKYAHGAALWLAEMLEDEGVDPRLVDLCRRRAVEMKEYPDNLIPELPEGFDPEADAAERHDLNAGKD